MGSKHQRVAFVGMQEDEIISFNGGDTKDSHSVREFNARVMCILSGPASADEKGEQLANEVFSLEAEAVAFGEWFASSVSERAAEVLMDDGVECWQSLRCVDEDGNANTHIFVDMSLCD